MELPACRCSWLFECRRGVTVLAAPSCPHRTPVEESNTCDETYANRCARSEPFFQPERGDVPTGVQASTVFRSLGLQRPNRRPLPPEPSFPCVATAIRQESDQLASISSNRASSRRKTRTCVHQAAARVDLHANQLRVIALFTQHPAQPHGQFSRDGDLGHRTTPAKLQPLIVPSHSAFKPYCCTIKPCFLLNPTVSPHAQAVCRKAPRGFDRGYQPFQKTAFDLGILCVETQCF